jgi:SAM-dependent methyltransferase
VRFYVRGTYGPFHRKSSSEGFEPLKRLRSLEDLALASCKGRVLNAGAGAGRHSLLLREAGFDVVSVDIAQALVDLMKRRGLDQVYQADIFTIDQGAFDTIIFLQHTIGLTGTLERLRELLALLKDRLGPRGQILLDSTSPRVISSPLRYAGEGEFQLKYRSLVGKPFPWLWIDFSVLSICARAAGYDAELLARGSVAGDYLARLTPQ